MKRILPFLLALASSCQPQTTDAPVPSGGISGISASVSEINVEDGTSKTVTFSWTAPDDEVIDVLFDKDGGDFSNPVYKGRSSQAGAKSLVLTYGSINAIARMAGIADGQQGKVRWTVSGSISGLYKDFATISVKRSSGGGEEPPTPVETHVHKERAEAFWSLIKQHYGTSSGLFTEEAGGRNTSFLWPYDGLVSGLACLNKLGVNVDYTGYVEKFQRYWRSSGVVNVGGYGSSTNGSTGSGDRFFDDNSIVGLNLVEAYRQTKDSKYLTRCAQIVKFLRSGEDNTFGGGLWWNESHKNEPGNDDSNKPCCANGYACWFLTSYYEFCPAAEKAEVLAFAKRLYDFLYTTLRDTDGLYWNSKGADGSLNHVKWTYNTGAMIASGARLYAITGEKGYLDAAKKSASAAYAQFVKYADGAGSFYPDHDSWFNVKLIRAYMELEPYYDSCKSYIDTFISNLDYAWTHARMNNGLFYEDWTGATPRPDRDKTLLMQDAVLEALGAVAVYKGE